MAAAKKHNREMEAQRRMAELKAARQRAKAERERELNRRTMALLDTLTSENTSIEQLRTLITALKVGVGAELPRTLKLIGWAEQRLTVMERRLIGAALEQRLTEAELFGQDDEVPDR